MQAPKASPLTSDLPDVAADVLARLRERRPRVHCITNAVAQAFTANVLLAAGAVPSMTIALADVAPVDDALRRYAVDQLCVVALTGATDRVTDGVRFAKIENGDPLMGRVTAMGCAGAALVAACSAVEGDA